MKVMNVQITAKEMCEVVQDGLPAIGINSTWKVAKVNQHFEEPFSFEIELNKSEAGDYEQTS